MRTQDPIVCSFKEQRVRDPGGEHGIRTHGTVTGTLDFESSAFDHSASSPRANLAEAKGLSTASTRPRTSPQGAEKIAEEGAAFVGEHASFEHTAVVEARVVGDGEERAQRPRLGIVSAPPAPRGR